MTTARTHQVHVGRGGAARPRVAGATSDGFTPVSAESFAAVEAGGEDEGSNVSDYDPADHTVEEVKAYIGEHPEQADAILELELNGKARSGLLSFIENLTEGEG